MLAWISHDPFRRLDNRRRIYAVCLIEIGQRPRLTKLGDAQIQHPCGQHAAEKSQCVGMRILDRHYWRASLLR